MTTAEELAEHKHFIERGLLDTSYSDEEIGNLSADGIIEDAFQ